MKPSGAVHPFCVLVNGQIRQAASNSFGMAGTIGFVSPDI
jgi:hypothetical protein